jgi:hypothetical protein
MKLFRTGIPLPLNNCGVENNIGCSIGFSLAAGLLEAEEIPFLF